MSNENAILSNVWWSSHHAYLQRCPHCGQENYILMVAEGICYACRYDANQYPACRYEPGKVSAAEHAD